MEETVKERLKRFIKAEGISEREFCRRVGVGSAYIQSIRKSIMPDTLQQITIQFPRLNPIWLMLGDGDMYQPEEEKKPEVAPSEVLLKLLDDAQNEKARLLSIIESQQRTIERLTELTKKADVHRADDAISAAVG